MSKKAKYSGLKIPITDSVWIERDHYNLILVENRYCEKSETIRSVVCGYYSTFEYLLQQAIEKDMITTEECSHILSLIANTKTWFSNGKLNITGIKFT